MKEGEGGGRERERKRREKGYHLQLDGGRSGMREVDSVGLVEHDEWLELDAGVWCVWNTCCTINILLSLLSSYPPLSPSFLLPTLIFFPLVPPLSLLIPIMGRGAVLLSSR
jgi:hypothetical protein